jgi:hypothetical protein
MAAAAAPAGVAAPRLAPVAALRARLDGLTRLVMSQPPDLYRTRTSTVSGAIGEQVRHVLDHVAALVGATPTRTLSYDNRARGTAIEIDQAAAVREMIRLDAALERFAWRPLDQPLLTAAIVDGSGEPLVGWSSLGRELAFVLNHTIHHLAIIGLLVEGQGGELIDARVGFAPSTPVER